MLTTQNTLFDYNELDTETRIVVQQRTSEIKSLMKRAAQDIIDIGQKLIEVKVRLGHGHFGRWLEVEFAMTDRTARNFMIVAESFKSETVSDLIAPKALYLLAAPSTPVAARIEALERAGAGEAITHSTAKDIVQAHKAPVVVEDERPADWWYGDDDEPEKSLPFDPATDTPPATYTPIVDRRDQQRAVLTSQASHEWHSPGWAADMSRVTMGSIDLDPASCFTANETIRAQRIYTIDDDGLLQDWRAATVFLNPPYNGSSAAWCRKAVAHYHAGDIGQAVILIFAKLGYTWFEELFDAFPTCLVRERICFVNPDRQAADTDDINPDGKAKHASAFIYLGQRTAQFRDAFRAVGRVILPEDGR